ncbi:Transposase [Oopsacas minuta]|uniref:Transposase n=1 Tax=Oopsacas minuta TaxID=111878 RepID=A0AAV7JNC2_9METZ|nr:Transposase [Oopsacas minuta]
MEDEERIGRPRSAVISSNTSEIRWRVEEDPHIAVEELAMSIPHSLTKDQKDRRVTCARKMLSEYKYSDPRMLVEIITGDETWTRYDEPLSKERIKIWVVKGEASPLNLRSDFKDQKVLYSIFFDAHG